MIIDKIYLFKTPLSNDYKNVYDSYGNNSHFLQFLKNNFNYTVIKYDLNISRSAKTENNSTQLSIKRSATEIYEHYNYCCIVKQGDPDYDEEQQRFYFILDVVSLSDVPEKESCLLNLEWDVWHNNYTNLRNKPAETNLILTSHYEEYNIDKDNNLLRSNNISTDEGYFSVNKSINSTQITNTKPVYKKDTKICFLRLVYDNETKMKNLNGDFINIGDSQGNLTINKIYKSNPLQIVFIPYCEVNLLTRQVVKDNGIYKVHLYPDKELRFARDIFPYFFKEISSHLISADLTFFPTVNFTKSSFGAPELWTYGEDENNVVDLGYLCKDDGTIIDKAVIVGNVITNSSDYSTLQIPNSLYSIPRNFRTLYGINDNDLITISKLEKISARFNNYPFNYLSIKSGDAEVDLIPLFNSRTLDLQLFEYDQKNAKYRVNYNNQPIRPKPTNTNNSGEITVINDSMSEFNRSNSSSVNTAKIFMRIKGALSMAESATKKDVAGIINSGVNWAENEVKLQSKLDDIDMAKDNIMSPTNLSTDELMFQDDIVLIKNAVVDEILKGQILLKLHYYGFNMNYYNNTFDNHRKLFDFIQTRNCDIKSIPSIKDRKALQDIFNNGVTKWHITSDNYPALKTFNKNYNNFSINM